MVLVTQRGGQCLFCSLRSAALLRIKGHAATNVKKQFSSGYAQHGILEDLLSPTRNALPSSHSGAPNLEPNLRSRRNGAHHASSEESTSRSFVLANEKRKIEAKKNRDRRRHALPQRQTNRLGKNHPVMRSPGKGAHYLTLESSVAPSRLDERSHQQRRIPIRTTSRGSAYTIISNAASGRGHDQTSPEVIHSLAMGVFERLRNKLSMEYYHQKSPGSIVDGFIGIATKGEFNNIADDFVALLNRSYCAANQKMQPISGENPQDQHKSSMASIIERNRADISDEASLFHELRQIFANDRNDWPLRIKHLFTKYVCEAQISTQTLKQQEKSADLRYPIEWFPATRALQRKIHLHVGPTNSGKTFHALQRLEQAESGLYAGPLRLLAHEVYSRLNAKGKPCSLITGEERRYPEGPTPAMSSCTVEMVPLNTEVEVAVIDEIQMLGDVYRGWAWTQAFLGVKAREIHVCGELRTIPLIEDLCKLMGDELTIHRYERLSPLQCMGKSLNGKLDKLEKGDCIILFSRVAIHAMKKEVEKVTGKRCAVVYGSLPPETRAQQAALFNDPDNEYDFLVASDAVGMGLNLAIRRVIFESLAKFNGKSFVKIPISEVKQIAGRAGRYMTASEAINTTADQAGDRPQSLSPKRNVGLVTTLDSVDHPFLMEAMNTDVQPLRAAGIFYPSTVLQKFVSYFPKGTPLSYITLRLKDIAKTNPLFFVCNFNEQLVLADLIEPFNMTLEDRLVFMAAPAAAKRQDQRPIIEALAGIIANRSPVDLLDIPELNFELLDENSREGKQYLLDLENLHQGITLYLWLSYRFSGVFKCQELGFHVKSLVEEKINESLAAIPFEEKSRRLRQALKLKALRKQVEKGFAASTLQTAAHTPMSYEDEDRQEQLLDMPEEEGHPEEVRTRMIASKSC